MSINYDIPLLKAFLTTSVLGSFHKAAHALALSPSALSRRIALLEEQMGVRLIDRTTRSVALTPAGRRLAATVAPLLLALEEGVTEVVTEARGGGGRMAVGCVTTVACSVLPGTVWAFRDAYPDIRIQVHDDTGKRVLEAVLSGNVEFAVNTIVQGHPDVHAEPVVDDPYVVVLPDTHELAGRGAISWASLRKIRMVALKRTSANRQQVDDALASSGMAVTWFDEVEHLSSMLGFLRHGNAVGIVPRLALLGSSMPGTCVRALTDPVVSRKVGLIRRADASLTLPASHLWSLLRTGLQQHGTEQGRHGRRRA